MMLSQQAPITNFFFVDRIPFSDSFPQPCRRSRRTTASRTTRFSSKSQVPSLTRLTITKIALASFGSSRRPTLEGLETPVDKQSLVLDQIRQEPHLGITTVK